MLWLHFVEDNFPAPLGDLPGSLAPRQPAPIPMGSILVLTPSFLRFYDLANHDFLWGSDRQAAGFAWAKPLWGLVDRANPSGV
jgi:hypothetical protein